MRLTISSIVALILVLATTASALQKLTPEQVDERARKADEEIWHLGKGTFEERMAQGTWLVYYGTTWCKFCKRLTPRWLRMQQEFSNQKLHNTGFLVSKVDCTGANEAWCAKSFKVDAYPTINLYHNGKFVEEYTGNHEAADILEYIRTKISFYFGADKLVQQ